MVTRMRSFHEHEWSCQEFAGRSMCAEQMIEEDIGQKSHDVPSNRKISSRCRNVSTTSSYGNYLDDQSFDLKTRCIVVINIAGGSVQR